jgi:3-methyladenine DNA glycosylase AlkD
VFEYYHCDSIMSTTAGILKKLKSRGSRKNIEGMARFGISSEGRLGVSMPEIRRIAKETGENHELAVRLWNSGIAEARIVASIIADPGRMTAAEMDRWASEFDSWDVCDQVCMNLFERTPFARQKIRTWARREEEFVRRAAYALIACLAWHDKDAPDAVFTGFLPIIKRGAIDERNFVKKAVNWALRNIGKRNPRLNRAAVRTAWEISRLDSKSARWIGKDAIRELTSAAVQRRIGRLP